MKNFWLILGLIIILCGCASGSDKTEVQKTDSTKLIRNNEESETVLQRNILGLELDKTTKKEAIKILEERGIDVYQGENKDVYFSTTGVSFGGIPWDMMGFVLADNKIMDVVFLVYIQDQQNKDGTVDMIVDLVKNLRTKYESYEIIPDNSKLDADSKKWLHKMSILLKDSDTWVQAQPIIIEGKMCYELRYMDPLLRVEQDFTSYSEL